MSSYPVPDIPALDARLDELTTMLSAMSREIETLKTCVERALFTVRSLKVLVSEVANAEARGE